MHLTSEIEPSGLKSTNHYVILHHNNRSDLITLPPSYPDLEKQVQKLYHIESGRFYIETDEFNLCKGKRIRIPQDSWDDIGRLLGNVHVIPSHKAGEPYDHPESSPEAVTTSPPYQAPTQIGNKGVIELNIPFLQDEILLIKTGHIDLEANSSSSTGFHLQLMDGNNNTALTVEFSPKAGSTTLASSKYTTSFASSLKGSFLLKGDHNIAIRKQGTRFWLMYDYIHIGTIDAPAHAPLTAVKYDLGDGTPFKGPLSAVVYIGLPQLMEGFAPYRLSFPKVDEATLFRKILNCDPACADAAPISRALETIRKEIEIFDRSSLGTKWTGHTITSGKWNDFEWNLQPHSMSVVRFTSPVTKAPQTQYLIFGPRNRTSLQLSIDVGKEVRFGERNSLGVFGNFKTTELKDAMQAPGEHAVVFVNQGDDLRVIFDYKMLVTVPIATMLARKPKELYFQSSSGSADVDVYEFSQ